MIISPESIPVSEFILHSERNLRVATAVYKHFEEARDRLMQQFFQRLTVELTKELPGWRWKSPEPFFSTRYGKFSGCKPAWENQYYVHLEATESGTEMTYGIWRKYSALKDRDLCPTILERVQQLDPNAWSNKWFEAGFAAQDPASDWTSPEILWRIHTDPEFLQIVAAHLLEVARATEAIIDALVARHPSA